MTETPLLDPYRVLPHRDVLDCTMYSCATGAPLGAQSFEHVPCGMDLKPAHIEDNWCPYCAATINKAAKRRANAEWK